MVVYHYLNGALWINAQINSIGETCFQSRNFFLIEGYRRAAILVPSTVIYNLHEWFNPNFSLKKDFMSISFPPSPSPCLSGQALGCPGETIISFFLAKLRGFGTLQRNGEYMVERGQLELSWNVASGLQKSALRNSYPKVTVAQRRGKYPLGDSIFIFQSN